jgi:XTP/dITP diphosphohydrolase
MVRKMKITFITTNKHKVEEAKKALEEFPIEIEQLDMEYPEDHDASIEIIAKTAAKKLAEELQKPIVVEDTGIFFEAYENFPGALPKFVFNTIGYKGMFKLLEEESRKAYFKVVVGFCEPGKEPILFDGISKGTITEEIYDEDKDVMPYERIFIHEGNKVTNSKLTREEKNKISHRAEAFRKLGGYINDRN